ncbi:MAG TPA: CcdB family protein [Deltaproteobacteria bacterium]|nr:CcdB family protein [Deltaproteobacteria bacterium]HXK47174.1 CcdB family protein [Deltaproteobacteria bacterium]
MAQFDVYENPNEHTKKNVPYLLDLQADLLNPIATRVVAPLVSVSAKGKPIEHLNPEFQIKRKTVYMSTAELAGVPVRALGEKVGTLKDQRQIIIAALDFLFTGF